VGQARAVSARGVAFDLHRRFLARFIQPGWRVLEVRAGPGRFMIELAALGARVVVSDISAVQLDMNRRKVEEAGHEPSVQERRLADVRDLSAFAVDSFDGVVAYGGRSPIRSSKPIPPSPNAGG
jgi:cyclopropane fatty-acyl-phospholipid synthase-like methyltransferase